MNEPACQYVLVRYYEEQPDDKGTMMPRVTWAVRRRGCRNVSWYDIVEAASVLRPIFLQPDNSSPPGVAFFVNTFVS